MHSEERPPLPRRVTDEGMSATMRLWRESECYDRATIERCLDGLHALDMPVATVQHEIDGVIARWRAQREVRRAY